MDGKGGLAARADLYELLARAFREEPTVEFLQDIARLSSEGYFSSFPFLQEREDGEAVERVRGAAEAGQDDLRTLRVEFAKLFLGPGKPVAPPWGSVYVDRTGSVMGASTLRVRTRYDEAGLVVDKKNVEPDDHVSFELSFVARLLAKALLDEDERRKQLLALAQSFVDECLALWVGVFSRTVEESGVGDFYPGLAHLLAKTVASPIVSLQ